MPARFMIVSDMDGTLLGDDCALAEFSQWLAPRREQFRLVYNSGRFPDSVRKSIEKCGLPAPDALIGGVGTEIEFYHSRERVSGWPEFAGPWDAGLVRQLLAGNSRLELQPERFLSDFKVSYYAQDATDKELAVWQSQLETAGLKAHMIYSSNRDLDFLPAGCDKGTATRFLANMWGFDASQVIVCGDTGNDLALFRQGFSGVVVGNALEELKRLDSPHVYHAAGDFAAGVLEGVEYWVGRSEARGPHSPGSPDRGNAIAGTGLNPAKSA